MRTQKKEIEITEVAKEENKQIIRSFQNRTIIATSINMEQKFYLYVAYIQMQ